MSMAFLLPDTSTPVIWRGPMKMSASVPYLGALPLDPERVMAGDEGRPIILRHADSPKGKAADAIMENLVHLVES